MKNFLLALMVVLTTCTLAIAQNNTTVVQDSVGNVKISVKKSSKANANNTAVTVVGAGAQSAHSAEVHILFVRSFDCQGSAVGCRQPAQARRLLVGLCRLAALIYPKSGYVSTPGRSVPRPGAGVILRRTSRRQISALPPTAAPWCRPRTHSTSRIRQRTDGGPTV